MSPLKNRTVLITGAARGIGAALARRVAATGARLSLVGLEPDLLKTLVDELGADRHAWFECDVTDQAAVDAAVAGTVDRFGRIDAVVANAGVANRGTVATNPPDDVARTIEVNLVGAVRTVGAALPHLVETRGYCLLVASAAAFASMPGMAAYGASKAGLERFGDTLRLEVAHKGVAVGVAYMTWIDTDLVRDTREDLASFETNLKRMRGPLGTVVPVEDCAEAFLHGLEHRSREIYVPGSVRWLRRARGLMTGPMGFRLMRGDAARSVPALEENVRRLGRSFGRNSV
ncbi:SDR family oxidoreductase [Virgisporangium aurantiacum]|uniref:Oxidoreductase n=1 Tax=Virgisporangium aurantiacum TaxID=175570 RepID=A0A8J3YZ27_9ACTN|nr:SDR family oxidoreductase [Virgisporangium aurantiacum]GIJ53327.1 oxidoreductase [Virgisporangium aurantiacum]